MWPVDQIKAWATNVVTKKALRSAVGVAVAWFCSSVIATELQKYGVTLNKAELEAGLMTLLAGGMEALRTWAKAKWGLKFL